MTPVATIRSCYSQRFGIPRQPGLVKSAVASIEFEPSPANRLALRGLDAFSHLWIIFVFHKHHYANPKPLVRPPRLGGRTAIGVYATRSPNRPNPIGLSAVKLDGIAFDHDKYRVRIVGGDFLDGTPVLDIKPYVPFVDAIDEATSEWATPVESLLEVVWSDQALEQLADVPQTDNGILFGSRGLKTLVEETLAQDPRPAHERGKDGRPEQKWGVVVGPVDVKFRVEQGRIVVFSVVTV